MMKYILSLMLCCCLNAFAQHPPVFEGMEMDTTLIVAGDLNVNLVRYKYGKPSISFLAIHDDEDTGVKAAFEYIQFNGGSIIDCQYGGKRNYKFMYNGQQYQTDPNSIYSNEGAKIGIEKFGPSNNEVVRQMENIARIILNQYNPKRLGYIFTLHNNADGGFGIPSYLKGYELEKVTDSLHINFQMDPDDMVLVTEKKLYSALKKANVNVVLQHTEADDDGSLSIYAKRNQIPYINVEVQHGHQEENLRLIEIAVKALYECYPNLKEKEKAANE